MGLPDAYLVYPLLRWRQGLERTHFSVAEPWHCYGCALTELSGNKNARPCAAGTGHLVVKALVRGEQRRTGRTRFCAAA